MSKEKITLFDPNYSLKKQLCELWKYSQKFHTKILILFVLTIVLSLVALLPPYLYGRIIDDLTNNVFSSMVWLLGFTALSHITYQIAHNYLSYKTKILSSLIRNQAKIMTYSHLFSLDFSYYEDNSLGSIFSKIETGAKAVRDFLKTLFHSTLIKVFTLIFSLVFIFTINVYIGLFSLFVFIAFFAHGIITTNKLIGYSNNVLKTKENTYGKVFDFFSNIFVVKILNIKDLLMGILTKEYGEIIDKEKISRRYERVKVATSKLFVDISTVLILSYIVFLVYQNSMTIGVGVMVFGFYTKYTGAMRTAWTDIHLLIEKRSGMYRMSLISQEIPSIKEPVDPQDPKSWNSISLKDVSFSYENKKVLDNLSLKISKGEKVAIVGISGSGKSTLAKLLLRLYLPSKGKITIGDENINHLSSNYLYSTIKAVPQENKLINTTIKGNLQLVTKRNVSKREMLQSLETAAAWDFIEKLPKQLDTVVGPSGVKLSGGEKQRLCLARALLTKPEVLLLDEATSHLDVITERKVHKALHDLPTSMTIIAITHRISSLNLFDRIIVLDKGKVVGKGTHKELLKNNKYYQELQKKR